MSSVAAVRVQRQAVLKALPVLKSLIADKEVGIWAKEELRKAPAHLNKLQQAERQAEVEEIEMKKSEKKVVEAMAAKAEKKAVHLVKPQTTEKKEKTQSMCSFIRAFFTESPKATKEACGDAIKKAFPGKDFSMSTITIQRSHALKGRSDF